MVEFDIDASKPEEKHPYQPVLSVQSIQPKLSMQSQKSNSTKQSKSSASSRESNASKSQQKSGASSTTSSPTSMTTTTSSSSTTSPKTSASYLSNPDKRPYGIQSCSEDSSPGSIRPLLFSLFIFRVPAPAILLVFFLMLVLLIPNPASAQSVAISSPRNTIYSNSDIWINWSADFMPEDYYYTLNSEKKNFTFLEGALHAPFTASFTNPSGGEIIKGMAFGKRYLYYTDDSPGDGMPHVYIVDTDSGAFTIVANFTTDINVWGMAAADSGDEASLENLFVSENSPSAHLYLLNTTRAVADSYCTRSGGCILKSAALPSATLGDMAFDGEYLWFTDYGTSGGKIRKLYQNGTQASEFTLPFDTPDGLAYDGNTLMLTVNGDYNIYRINQTQAEKESYCSLSNNCIISVISSASNYSLGLAYDNRGEGALWSSDTNTDTNTNTNTNTDTDTGANTIYRHQARNMAIAFPDSRYALMIFAGDKSGNTAMSGINFTVDTKPPEIAIISPGSRIYNITEIPVNALVRDNTTAVGSCYMSIDGSVRAPLPHSADTFAYNLTGLGDEQHVLSIFCSDMAGNENTSHTYFTVDTQAPLIAINLEDNTTLTSSPVSISFTVNENSACAYILNNNNPAPAVNNKITDAPAVEGINNITLSCTDSAGNTASSRIQFNLDTKRYITIKDLPPGAALRINNATYGKGDVFSTGRGTEISIETSFNSRTYTDKFELDRSFDLYVNATILGTGNNEASHSSAYFDISSSYRPYMIYIIEDNSSAESALFFTARAPLSNVTLSGLHINVGGKLYLGDHAKGEPESYIENLVILGTLEIVSGSSSGPKNTSSQSHSLDAGAVIGRADGTQSLTNLYVNLLKSGDILFTGKPSRGYYIQELDMSGTKEADGLKIATDIDGLQTTILSADIKNATVSINCTGQCRVNERGPQDDRIVAEEPMFWYKARNTSKYNFTLGWIIRGNGNYINSSDIGSVDTSHSKNISLYSVWKDHVGPSHLNLFSLDSDGAVYLRSRSNVPSLISIIGPAISADNIIIDDIPLSSLKTSINFYADSSIFTLPPSMMHDYKNDTNGRYYSDNIILRSKQGHFIAGNDKSRTTFSLAQNQDIILLTGSDRLNLESASGSENEWSVTHSGASHWIIENTTAPVNLTGYISIQPDKWFLSGNISITSFAYNFNTTTLHISSSTDHANGTMYLLYRPLGSISKYQRMNMQKSASLWHAYLPVSTVKDYDIIIVAVENDSHSGKALEKTIHAESIPPAITLITPSGDIKTNRTDIAIKFRASDNTAHELVCRLKIDNADKSAAKIMNSTEAILSAVNIPEGIHTYRLFCEDLSHNIAETPPMQLIVDLTPPSLVALNSPSSGGKKRGSVFINVSASDALSGVGSVSIKVTDRNGNRIFSNLTKDSAYYTGSYNSGSLADGAQSIAVAAFDASGNTNTSSSVQITTDNTGPYIHLSADKSSATVGGAIRFTVAFDESDAVRNTTDINIMLGSNLVKSYRYTDLENISSGLYRIYLDTTGMSGGRYRMTATVEDTLGNEGTEALEFTLSSASSGSQDISSSSRSVSSSQSAGSAVQSFPGEPENQTTVSYPSTAVNSANIPEESKNNTEDTSFNATLNAAAGDFSGRERALKETNQTHSSSLTGRALNFISSGVANYGLMIAFALVIIIIILIRMQNTGLLGKYSGYKMQKDISRIRHLSGLKKIIRKNH